MRYIHGNNWDAKLLEALITERMKPLFNALILKLQIGCKAGHASVEHLVILKTWMKELEANDENFIFEFGYDYFFYDKSLIITHYTL